MDRSRCKINMWDPLLKNSIRISKWRQQSIKPIEKPFLTRRFFFRGCVPRKVTPRTSDSIRLWWNSQIPSLNPSVIPGSGQVSLGIIQEEVLSINGQKQQGNGRTLGYKVSFWGAENVLGLDTVVIVQPCDCAKTHWFVTLKHVDFTVCGIYFNKAVFLKKIMNIIRWRIRVTSCPSLPRTKGFPGTWDFQWENQKSPKQNRTSWSLCIEYKLYFYLSDQMQEFKEISWEVSQGKV